MKAAYIARMEAFSAEPPLKPNLHEVLASCPIGFLYYVYNVPTKPYEYCAQEDKRGVVRFAMRSLALVLSLAKHEGIGQCGPTGSNVHRSTTSKVQRRQLVEPAVGVPSPACDGAVDNRGPPEAKYK